MNGLEVRCHLQRQISVKSLYIISWNVLDAFVWPFFGSYHVIHAWCKQSKSTKWSLNYFCGNEYFKYVIDGKVYKKLSVKAREKNILRQNKFEPHFLSLNCVKISMGALFRNRLSSELIRRVRYLTTYDFRQVHLIN